MFCKNCGTENNDTDNFCKNCGQPLREENVQQKEAMGNTQSNPEPSPVQYSSYQSEPLLDNSRPSGAAIASMILGIVSIIFCCLHIIVIACGIVAIVLAKKEEQKGVSNGFTKAGFICGLIGAVLGGIFFIYWIITVVVRGSFAVRTHTHF